MPRSVDLIQTNQQARGWDMTTNARENRPKPSLADGVVCTATAAANVAPGSPGAVLGTGMNADRYTPNIEAS